jgi:hypothetical protein
LKFYEFLRIFLKNVRVFRPFCKSEPKQLLIWLIARCQSAEGGELVARDSKLADSRQRIYFFDTDCAGYAVFNWPQMDTAFGQVSVFNAGCAPNINYVRQPAFHPLCQLRYHPVFRQVWPKDTDLVSR